jgi:hypothetical protein
MIEPQAIGFMTFVGATTYMVIRFTNAFVRRMELRTSAARTKAAQGAGGLEERLNRIEQAVDAIAVEVERISEGQRFTTKLLADVTKDRHALSGGSDLDA